MGLFSFCLGKPRRRTPAVDGPDSARSGLCGAVRRDEPPLSFSELVAASSFLDLGGLIDERWFFHRHSKEECTHHRRK
jgi:hypothetical protein